MARTKLLQYILENKLHCDEITNSLVHLSSLAIVFHGTNPAFYTQNLIRRKDTITALRATSGRTLHNLKLFSFLAVLCSILLDMMIKLSKRQCCQSRGKPTHIPICPLSEVWWEGFTLYLYLSFKKDSRTREFFEWNMMCYLRAFKSYLLKSPAHFFSGGIDLFFHKTSPCFISPPYLYFFFLALISCHRDSLPISINWTLMVLK